MELNPQVKEKLERALSRKGLRSTRQREQVLAVVLESSDHPSADTVYSRVKEEIPGISLATVYNCLETLYDCDLIRQINFERSPSRYCVAKGHHQQHAHFHCQETGKVFDVDLPETFIEELRNYLPGGFSVEKIDLTLSGKSEVSTSNN
jgi:Fur family peroxide stress response transcriptional regulator